MKNFKIQIKKMILDKTTIKIGLLAVAFAIFTSTALAGYFPLPDSSYFGDLPDPASDLPPDATGIDRIEKAVTSVLLNVRILIGSIAVAIAVFAGGMMALRGGDDSSIDNHKSAILNAIIGLVVIGIAGAGTELLSVENGGLFNPNTAKERVVLFRVEVNILITFVRYMLGSLAVFGLIAGAFGIVSTGGNEDALSTAKNRLLASGIGLAIIMFSTIFIDKVFYVVDLNASTTAIDPQINSFQGVRELVAITNIVVSIVGPIMILMLVIGGFMYALSAGDDGQIDKAKALIKNAIIGCIVIYGAFAIVATFISGQI